MVGRVFLGRYETIHRLGEGGMGCVYKAKVIGEKDPVVVKVMHSHIASNPRFRERFNRETRLMKRFKHPNSVAFIDASLDDPEGPCIVMEYLNGITLDKLLAQQPRLSPMRLRRLLAQFCDVLQAAHEAGIIHRDLKPANLMVLEPDTPFEKLKVMDFGLAEMASGEPGDGPEKPEYAVGTPGYMPPEQVRGEPMDHRGDLYSVGVILYLMLTGKMPFSGESMMEILMAQATEGPPTFASLGLSEAVPEPVEDVVRACLAADPEQRPDSARLIGAAYEEALVLAFQGPRDNAAVPAPEPTHDGPPAEVFQLEAWLPETIAKHKLRGFVDAVGGRIVDNEPGRILVRLPKSRSASAMSKLLSTFGMKPGAGPIAMELQMTNKDPGRPNLLHITVLMRPEGKGPLPADKFWKDRCNRNMVALRGYLMS